MKFSKRMICLFLTVMLLGAVLALPAYAAESDCIQGIAFVNATSLRMRSEPSSAARSLHPPPRMKWWSCWQRRATGIRSITT